jgi:PhzF family phenazine biosynthesis protein
MDINVPVVNAFVANGKGGNPAGVVLEASVLSDEQMQYIAHEVGASETAFVLPDEKASYRLRFFTPTVEVDLCGHATIATWSHMYANGHCQPGSYLQNTLAGFINISVSEDGLVFMEQPEQKFGEVLDYAVIAKALDIPEEHFDKRFTPQIVQQALLLGFKSKELLNNFSLDAAKLIELNRKYNFKGLHIFVMLENSEAIAAVRDFDPIVGIDEDAATGTTNGSFLTYLRHYNVLPDQEVYKIEQGEAMGQLSSIYGKFKNDRVWIGGTAAESKHLQLQVQKT